MHMLDEGGTMDLGIDGQKNAFNAVCGSLRAISHTLRVWLRRIQERQTGQS
jgi:hypothetical protein